MPATFNVRTLASMVVSEVRWWDWGSIAPLRRVPPDGHRGPLVGRRRGVGGPDQLAEPAQYLLIVVIVARGTGHLVLQSRQSVIPLQPRARTLRPAGADAVLQHPIVPGRFPITSATGHIEPAMVRNRMISAWSGGSATPFAFHCFLRGHAVDVA